MSYNYYLFVLLIAISCCLLYIAYLAWRKRENTVAFSFFFGMCASVLYSFGYAFELISTNLEQIKFWLKVEYIGISFGTLIWFLTIVLYTGSKVFLRKWIILLMAIIPILTFISHYTNDWHHLFYRNIVINEAEGFPLASTTAGPFYILHTAYSYLLVFIGMGLLIQMYRKAAVHMKKQVVLLIIGTSGPYGITCIYLSGMLNTPIDISPIGFLFLGIFFIWGIYQFNMMKLDPYAFQKVFESMKEAVIVVDLNHLITSFNPTAAETFKELEDKKVIGKSALHIFSPYPELVDMLTQGDSIGRKIHLENQYGLKFYQVYSSYVRDKRENPVAKMLLLNDITEAVHSEERLRSQSKQLRELNTFKDKMFTVVAHDIRDPLSILISLMEILKEEIKQDDENYDEVVYEMDKQIHNTFSLVESLLDWFRNQRGGMMFNPIVVNVSRTIQTNVDLLQSMIVRKRINVVSQIEDDSVVYADKEMLELIIRNLLTNAIKFTEFDGTIFLNAEEVNGKIIITIKDTGIGIHPDQAKVLLQEQELYPISSTGTVGERGIGIGLTLCKEFVKINGGEMWFDSAPNQGSIFYFSLPIPIEKDLLAIK